MSRLLLLSCICVLITLAIPTGIVAIAQSAGVIPLPFNLYVVVDRLPGIFTLHMFASGAALALMPLVFATRKRRSWHRPLGRLTAPFVILGALTSFPVAYESMSPLIARLGFAAQGTVWLALIVLGIIAIRRKERARHAVLMAAMAAVASGAIWVRLTTTLATSFDWPFEPVYATATWLGWLIPMSLVFVFSPVSLLPTKKPSAASLVAQA